MGGWDELLNGERVYSLRQAQVVIKSGRPDYNTIRPDWLPGYGSTARKTIMPAGPGCAVGWLGRIGQPSQDPKS